jgi:hypothetical protein
MESRLTLVNQSTLRARLVVVTYLVTRACIVQGQMERRGFVRRGRV